MSNIEKTFESRVIEIVDLIPYGKVSTYGQIADLTHHYGYARQVGWVLRRLSLPSKVPWHRVVNAKGFISMSLSREGTDWMQRSLLIKEGIPVDLNGRLSLETFLWSPTARENFHTKI